MSSASRGGPGSGSCSGIPTAAFGLRFFFFRARGRVAAAVQDDEGPIVNNLIALQKLDLKIEQCLARETEIPLQKDKYKIRRARLAEELKASEERVKALQLEQRDCEKEIDQKKATIDKYNNQLLSVKKNEEYQALLHEIDIVKKQIGIKEERIIAILVELDEARERLAEDKRRVDAELKRIEEECAAIDKELADAVAKRKELEARRAPYEAKIEPGLLARYNRIRKAKKTGAAVVPLRNDFCSGCNMVVTPQIVNEILAGDRMHSCNHCGRLLYHPGNIIDTPLEVSEA